MSESRPLSHFVSAFAQLKETPIGPAFEQYTHQWLDELRANRAVSRVRHSHMDVLNAELRQLRSLMAKTS